MLYEKANQEANNISVMSIDVQKSITHYWLIIAFFYMIEKVCAVVFDEFCCSNYFKIENSFIGKVLMNWMHSAFDTIYAKHPNVFNFIGLKLTFILGLSSFGPRMKKSI